MKTYLLLYAERPTRRVFAQERPGRLILAGDAIDDEDRLVYDECIDLPHFTKLEETMDILRSLDFDELVVQTEYGLLPGSLLAGERGMKSPSPESVLLCTNKWLSRQVCKSSGVEVPEFKLVESAQEVLHFAQKFPLVIKPVVSTLGRLVMKVDSKEELEHCVHRMISLIPEAPDIVRCNKFAKITGLDMDCDPCRQFLVEEFIAGEAEESDGLVFGDEICLFGGIRQILTYTMDHFYIDAYILSQEAGKQLSALTEKTIRASKLTDAGFSIEMRGGKVIEINGRLGEDDGFPDLFKAALGDYPILKWLRADASMAEFNSSYALAYVNWYRGGKVESIECGSEATAVVSAGEVLNAPPHPDVLPHLAYAIAEGKTSGESLELARQKLSSVQFKIN